MKHSFHGPYPRISPCGTLSSAVLGFCGEQGRGGGAEGAGPSSHRSSLRPLAAHGTPGPALVAAPAMVPTAAVLIPAGGRGRVALGRLGEVSKITPLPVAVLSFWELPLTIAGKLTGVLGAFFHEVCWCCVYAAGAARV